MPPRHAGARPRILIDQSGYHLLNLGDIAMLQGAVARLRGLWADARIEIVCHAPERLRDYCPEDQSVRWISDGDPTTGRPSRRARAAAVQLHKMLTPYSLSLAPAMARRRLASLPHQRGLVAAIERSDIVVAAGGGYVNDAFWWHGFGVLSVLALAKALGKPTAMFGQGIGPLKTSLLRRQARHVLPSVDLIGLREGRMGPSILRDMGVDERRVVVTGDDALELVDDRPPVGHKLGVNLRVARYSALDTSLARDIARAVGEVADDFQAPVVGLPVSRYPRDGDLPALHEMFSGCRLSRPPELVDFVSPEQLMNAASDCRVVLTGSYHAAILSLSQGVSCVCVSASSYYDQKFAGVAELFPGIRIVAADAPDLGARVRAGLSELWERAGALQDENRSAAERQRDIGRQTYERFKHLVEAA